MAILGNLSMVRLFSDTFEKTVTFYKDTLELTLTFQDDNIAVFDAGSCQLGVEAAAPNEHTHGRFSGISFEVSDLSEVFRTLTSRKVPFVGDPAKQYWGGSLAHFSDPGGNVLTLVEYPKDA